MGEFGAVEAALGAAVVGADGGARIGGRPLAAAGPGADIYSLQKKSFERTRV